jgi:acetylornithine deacetylase/succinyl-diaminopimelate desuccinylase-like protein
MNNSSTKSDRAALLARAADDFDNGVFQSLLARRIAIPSTSHEADKAWALNAYLADEIAPYLRQLGFDATIYDNPESGAGPLLVARRVEDPGLPTILTYGHGDTVRGMDGRWRAERDPWQLTTDPDDESIWYGRGSADNKGQHSVNLAALAHVLEARDGRLGYNVTVLIETAEEMGSIGLRPFCKTHADLLAADLFLASDGPRISQHRPTIFLGSRGVLNFRLTCDLRSGGNHSGNWGGILPNAATRLAHGLATLVDASGVIAVAALRNPPLSARLRADFAKLELARQSGTVRLDPDWGEPGHSPEERVFGLNSLEILSIESGGPVEDASNAIPGKAEAVAQLRFTVDTDWRDIVPAVAAHLSDHGFADIKVAPERSEPMPATRLGTDHPAVALACRSIHASLGAEPAVLPNLGGTIPNDCFAGILGQPTIWVPHSYAGCSQHAPDEHVLGPMLREAMVLMAGLWWDLGEADFDW